MKHVAVVIFVVMGLAASGCAHTVEGTAHSSAAGLDATGDADCRQAIRSLVLSKQTATAAGDYALGDPSTPQWAITALEAFFHEGRKQQHMSDASERSREGAWAQCDMANKRCLADGARAKRAGIMEACKQTLESCYQRGSDASEALSEADVIGRLRVPLVRRDFEDGFVVAIDSGTETEAEVAFGMDGKVISLHHSDPANSGLGSIICDKRQVQSHPVVNADELVQMTWSVRALLAPGETQRDLPWPTRPSAGTEAGLPDLVTFALTHYGRRMGDVPASTRFGYQMSADGSAARVLVGGERLEVIVRHGQSVVVFRTTRSGSVELNGTGEQLGYW